MGITALPDISRFTHHLSSVQPSSIMQARQLGVALLFTVIAGLSVDASPHRSYGRTFVVSSHGGYGGGGFGGGGYGGVGGGGYGGSYVKKVVKPVVVKKYVQPVVVKKVVKKVVPVVSYGGGYGKGYGHSKGRW